MSQVKSQIGFAQKYGLKYYTFLINLFLFVGTYELTRSMEIVGLVVFIVPWLGRFLPADEVYKQKNANEYNKTWYHMLAPVVAVFQLFFILYYTWINYNEFSHSYQSLGSAIFALAMINQTIDACHELIHRNETPLRAIGFIGLIPFLFTTYPIEHLFMHHKHVGTPEDDITAPKNMPFLKYYVKSVFSSYRQTFRYSKLFFAFCMVLHLGYLFGLYQFGLTEFQGIHELALGKMGFFLAAALTSLFFMESIEYIEHYGLVYRKNNQEKPVLNINAWNTSFNPVYNWTTFRFQRHSDHHMNAYKVYSSLELNKQMPMYPFSFPEAIVAAWNPSIWYKIADHLVDRVINREKITKEDIEKSNNWMRISNIITFAIVFANVFTSNIFSGLVSQGFALA